MESKARNHTIDVLFVLILFAVFALSVVSLTGTGAQIYSNLVDSMETNYEARTASAYLINKIHAADSEGNVRIGTFGDGSCVLLLEEIDNITYCTYLYHYDGQLMELFTRLDDTIDPKYGTAIMEADIFTITALTDSLTEFQISDGKGGTETLYVHTRSGH